MSIESTIEQYIRDELLISRNSEIGFDESLISTGLLDSLTLLQLIAFLEETYDIAVDDSEMDPDNFQTINAMKTFIEQKLDGD